MHSVTLTINFLFCMWPLLLGSVESAPAKKQKGAQWPANYDFDYDSDDEDFEDNSNFPHHLLAELPLDHPLISEAFGRQAQKLSNRTPPQPDRSLITKNSVAVWANELKQDMDKEISELTSKQTNVSKVYGNSLVRYIADYIKYAYNYMANLYQSIVNNLDKYDVEKLMDMYDLEKKTYVSLKEMIALFYSILSTPSSAVPATNLKKIQSSIEEITQKDLSESDSHTTKPRNSKKRQKKLAFTRPKNPHASGNIAWSYYDEIYAPYK